MQICIQMLILFDHISLRTGSSRKARSKAEHLICGHSQRDSMIQKILTPTSSANCDRCKNWDFIISSLEISQSKSPFSRSMVHLMKSFWDTDGKTWSWAIDSCTQDSP